MRWLAVAVAALAVAASCAQPPDPDASPAPAPIADAYVERAGITVRGDHVGNGAVIRTDRPLRDIELEIDMYAGERLVTTERDTLPYCRPNVDCPWGQSLFGEHLSDGWQDIDRIDVRITGVGGAYEGEGEIGELAAQDDGNRVSVRPDAREGTVYLMAFQGDTPVFGLSFFTTSGETGVLGYSRRVFPTSPDDTLRAVFYPGPVPARVHGPVD